MKLAKIEDKGFIGITALIMLVFFFFVLGFSGMMTTLGIMLLFMLPIYLILNNFELEQDEQIIFSFFIGAGIFPSITYWLGLVISFRIAVFITFAMMLIAAILVIKFYNRKSIA